MTTWKPQSNSSTRNFQGYRYNGMVRTNSSNAWPPRLADPRNVHLPRDVNAFQFGENQNNTTGYSTTGHIYEEVGPPAHPPPYLTSEMEARPASVHQSMDHHFRGSPASLCSSCSVRCSGHLPMVPTLPMCNCMSAASATVVPAAHTMPYQQPFCNIHSSISHSQLQRSGSPRTLNNGYIPQQCAHNNTMGEHHHAVPCTLHLQTMMGVSNQRYTGTITPEPTHNQTDTKNKNRSLSPFAFLKKNNRDSKASTNTMLDSTSGKSLLNSCNKKWVVAILVTFLLIILVSVAVAVAVIFTAPETKKSVGADSRIAVERVTSKIKASVRVIRGGNSVFSHALDQKSSPEFQAYAELFVAQANYFLQSRNVGPVAYTEVLTLSNGSVIVEFMVHIKDELSEAEAITLANKIRQEFRLESGKSLNTAFNQHFRISPQNITAKPFFKSSEPKNITTVIPSTTTAESVPPTTPSPPPTIATLPPPTIPPASGVCQPISESVCQKVYYNSSGTTFPNFAGHREQAAADVLATIINSVMVASSCYEHLNTFSCALLIPRCGAVDHNRIPPCKGLCEAAFENCGAYLNAVFTAQDVHVNCSSFPDSDDTEVCVGINAPIVPTSAPTCPEGYFSCDNHTCHENKDRCDTVNDCQDLTDERGCANFQCVPGQFQCANNLCKPRVWKCDGRDDCGDGSDEEDCEPVAPCQRGEFKCTNGYNVWNSNAAAENDVCIQGKYTCDRNTDCTDGSDEDSIYCRIPNNGR